MAQQYFESAGVLIPFAQVTGVLKVADDAGQVLELHVYTANAPARDGVNRYWLILEEAEVFLHAYRRWLDRPTAPLRLTSRPCP